MDSFLALFEEKVRKCGQKTALKDPEAGISLSYSELDARVRQIAGRLRLLKVGHGDNVAIVLPHSVDYITAMLAVLKLGAAVAPLNGLYPPDRLAYIFKDCRAKAVVTPDFLKAAEGCEPITETVSVSGEDPAVLVYTSGSTGNPKGVQIDQSALFDSVMRVIRAAKPAEDDVVGLGAPFFFIAGTQNAFAGLAAGLTNVLISMAAMRDPAYLSKLLAENGVTITFISPKILRYFKSSDPHLRLVMTGSERLSGIWSDQFGILNTYGLSESCGGVMGFLEDKAYDNTPIGKPLGDECVYLLDEDGKEAEAGELCLTGNFASGYLNLPEASAKTFTENPFRKKDGHPMMLRTGDLAQRLPDGNIVYVNRKDWMVKINGQRVEPGEIEAELRKVPGILDAAVKDFTNAQQSTYLAAFYVSKEELGEDALRKALREKLPEYMIPAFFVRMATLPLNPNGKLDRSQLMPPDARNYQAAYAPPETPEQKILCKAFARILNVERIGIDDDFFALGGDSIKAAGLQELIGDLPLTPADLYQGKTVRVITEKLKDRKAARDRGDNLPVSARAADVKQYPLMPMERSMYLEQKIHPESISYNLNIGVRIKGTDAGMIRKAVRSLFQAHEALHSRYGEKDGVPCRILTDEIPEIRDGKELSQAAFRHRLEDPGKPFDLEAGIPVRAVLYPLREGGSGLHLQIHHIAFDGGSAGILMQELVTLLKGGKTPEGAADLYGICVRQQTDSDPKTGKDIAFYEKMFEDGIPENGMPLKGPRPKEHPLSDTVLSEKLGEKEIADLEKKAKQYGVTLFELLLSVSAATLGKYCASADVVLGVPVNTRDVFSAGMIGMFVNTVPVRIRPEPGKKLFDFFAETAQTVREATRSCCVPFDELVGRFCAARDASRNPLFDMSVNYLPVPEAYRSGELSVDGSAPLQQMGRDIGLVMKRSKKTLQVQMQYSSRLFDANVMRCFLEQFAESLRRLAWSDAVHVRDLTVLPEKQAVRLDAFSRSAEAKIPEKLLHRVFEKWAAKQPDETALIASDRTLTYGELNEEANRMAWNLIRRGVKRGNSIVLLLPRRSFYFAAMFAVLKTGAAFIPCDPEYPAERIRHIIDDSDASFIITTEDRLQDYPAGKVLEIGALSKGKHTENPKVALRGNDLAYMIYTSGSTGKPKGVMLRHEGICNYLYPHPANIHYDILRKEVHTLLSVTTVSFDMSFKETTGALCNGKTLVFADETEMNDPRSLAELFGRTGADCFNATPSRLMQYLEYAPFRKALSRCRLVMSGGEGYPMTLRDRLKTVLAPDAHIINTYGPTEITVSSNGAEITKADHISVGRPLLNYVEYIVDADGNRVPPGVTGELLIGGPGVAAGYRNLPQETEEHFVTYLGTRVYRTGDYARWDAEGNVEILGRMDGQVKLRGLRIELGEVESVMEQQPGIRRAAAAVRQINGQDNLCAWFTADQPVDVLALRDALRRTLTYYMVPTALMQVEKIPETPNGKTDLKALPEPEILREKCTPPQNETQKKIFDIVAGVIGSNDFGIETELFSAGLTSLNSVNLSIKLSEAFSVNVQIRDFRENDTVEKLERFILGQDREDETFPVQDEYTVTKIQEGILFETQSHPGTTIYNIPTLIELDRSVDPGHLKTAITAAVAAHPYMKVRFLINAGGEIRQRRMDSDPFTEDQITEQTCGTIDEIKDNLVKPFDPLKDRLFRFSLIRTKETNYLFLDVHHLICDGTGRAILLRDVSRAYSGEKLKAETYSGYEAALLEEKLRAGEHYEKAKKYYTDLFSGCEPDCLPIPDAQGEAAGAGSVTIHAATAAEKISAFCTQHQLSENAFYTAAFGYAVARYCDREDVIIATVNNGRNDPRFLESVSMFVRTYPVLCRTGDRKITEYITSVSGQLLDSLTYDVYSFGEMSRDLGVRADPIFVWQGAIPREDSEFCGAPCRQIPLALNEGKADIEFSLYPTEDGNILHCGFRAAAYTEDFIRGFVRVYDQVLSEFIGKETLQDIELADKDTMKLLDGFNDSAHDYEQTDIVTLFRRSAAALPERPAVVFQDRTYTYRQADEISERIAAFLKGKGIGQEDTVSVLIPRGEYMVLASLGILKAGAAYQPLDPSYPQERLEFMISDAGAKLLIADRNLLDRVSGYKGGTLCLDEISALPAAEQIPESPKPEDAFILLYTSGSTGTPKGVILEHRNLCNYCAWHIRYYGLDKDSVTAAYASYGFDACMGDLYPPLISGGCICIVPDEIRLDFPALQQFFNEHGITQSFMTTQVGRQFAEYYTGTSLKHLVVGGETLVPIDPHGKPFAFHNGYGPTENTMCSTIFAVDRLYQRVPIGGPLDNVRLYVTDRNGRRLPPGVPGELWVAGHSVSRGYLNRPEKTAEVYIPNPFTRETGYDRVYRTGDVVRFLPDGNLDFIGRSDGLVKVRGFRIELTEVEAVIRSFPGIDDVTVQAYDAPAGGKYLAAYVVSSAPVDVAALNEFIGKKKPPYMIPEVTMQIDRIPLNQNQKVNRRALPVPERKTEEAASDTARELTALEQELVDACAGLTGNKDFGVVIPLTEAGLTSISAMQLMVLLEKKYGYSPNVTELLRDMRIIDIENVLVEHWRTCGTTEATADAGGETVTSAPLTQTQMGIYVEYQMDKTSDKYNIPFLLKLGRDADAKRLADAIRTAVGAHPSMLCSVEPGDKGTVEMIAHPDLEWTVSVEESPLDDAALEKELTGEQVTFKLSRAPLFRFRIVTNKTSLYLSMVFHHILMDGTSAAVLMEDIEQAYQGGQPEKERYTSLNLGLDEKARRDSDALAAAKAVYDGIFSGVNVDSVPAPEKQADRNGPGKAAIAEYPLADVPAGDAAAFCKANQVTENALFTAAFAMLLARTGGGDEAQFASIYNGRTRTETLRIMGMLVKTYPLYVNCEAGSKTGDFVRSVQKQIQELTANDLYSFAEAVHDYGVSADVLFAYQGDTFTEFTLAGQKAVSIVRPVEDAKEPLSVDVWKKDGQYIVSFEYRKDMYAEAQMKWMADAYAMLLRGVMKQATLGEIPLLSGEARAFLEAMNDTDVAVPFRPAHCLMEESAARYPDRTAVITPAGRVTYKELNENANRIAHGLIDLHATGRVVSLMLPRDERVYMVRQGILKAGGAFLSIVPDYPDERVRVMVEDSGSAVLVVTEELLKERGSFLSGLACPVVTVEKLLAGKQTKNPDLPAQKDDPAYCIFTSGSTGKPKGVMLTQGNLVNFTDANPKNREILGYTERGHVSLALAAITFDVSIMEEFIPLSHGMTVCMATDEEIHNPVALAKLMTENHVDVMSCTPSFLVNIIGLSMMKEPLSKVVSYDFGAEAFPASLYDKIRAINPDAYIMNGYGPTEATISCTMDPVIDPGMITIGLPAANVRAYILDGQGNILPPLMPGELIIAGAGVGKGYIGMPDLTAEKFFTLEGRPAYHTGDVAAWTSDGRLRFHGRSDNQVKLRGLRVELGEVENAINAVPGVLSSIVVMAGSESNRFLAGYYTASREITADELRTEISKTLTPYMVPDVLTQLETMPLTANGKIDKKKLPAVEKAPSQTEYVPPENETEQFFCELFRDVLGAERIGATDDFFACGGTSLTATSVMIRASEANYPMTYGDVFKYKTPRALAARFTGAGEEQPAEVPHPSMTFDQYDYTRINEVLSRNTLASFSAGESREIGNILLTGATGFMGMHVLAEFLRSEKGKAWCIVRKGKFATPFERLKSLMFYYFEESLENMEDRIVAVDGDVADYDTFKQLEKQPVNTVFNCAAVVKHYSSGTEIEDINVGGTRNALRYSMATGARLIHFSTTSVGGFLMVSSPSEVRQLDEQSLYFGQITDNQYISSKLLSERIVLEAVAEKGADAKVIRVGSLSARESDGEFQINFLSNSAMGQLRCYALLKSFPLSFMNQTQRFGPIDTSAKSFLHLAKTPKECCLFHAVNNHVIPTIDVIRVMQECGIGIKLDEDEVFMQKIQEADKDPRKAAVLSSILAYKDIAKGAVPVEETCGYTSQVLARTGFFWNPPDKEYIRKFIGVLAGLGFFDEDNLQR